MRRIVLSVLGLVCLLPAWASEPGQPLDCSDWVFLEPGLVCTEFISDCVRVENEIGETTSIPDPMCFNSQGTAMDTQGALYRIRWRSVGCHKNENQ